MSDTNKIHEIAPCGTKAPERDDLLLVDSKIMEDAVFRIPVIFTVLYNKPESNELITDAVLTKQIKVLNEDFRATNADRSQVVPTYQPLIADCKFEFFLKEVRRIKTNTPQFFSFMEFFDPAKGGVPVIDSLHNCNIYFVDGMEYAGGQSIFPTTGVVGQPFDGNLVRIGSWLSRPESSGFRIATHEVGHWFYLWHSFQGGCNPPGDYCDDTPPIPSSSGGCQLDRKACDSVTVANIQNHMDYSECRLMFTPDQVKRMRSTIMTVRSGLIGDNPPPPPPPPTGFITLVEPKTDNVEVQYPKQILFLAEASKPLTKVDWILNGSSWFPQTVAPYQISVRFNPGNYLLKAKGFATDGTVAETRTVSVKVTTSAPTNQPPVANAGSDITTTANTVTLKGSGSDPDGSVVAYRWDKVAGGQAMITSPHSAETTVTGLAGGLYQFKLTVTDDKGLTGSDIMNVTVESADSPVKTIILKANNSLEFTAEDGRKKIV